jgi:hypothetical protein
MPDPARRSAEATVSGAALDATHDLILADAGVAASQKIHDYKPR